MRAVHKREPNRQHSHKLQPRPSQKVPSNLSRDSNSVKHLRLHQLNRNQLDRLRNSLKST